MVSPTRSLMGNTAAENPVVTLVHLVEIPFIVDGFAVRGVLRDLNSISGCDLKLRSIETDKPVQTVSA